MIGVDWHPRLALPRVHVKKKSPYFGLIQGIFLTSLHKFGVSDRKYEFKICKKNHVWKTEFAHRDKRGGQFTPTHEIDMLKEFQLFIINFNE